jgi:SPP1 gp7 family putative phage head morphogenesis protein
LARDQILTLNAQINQSKQVNAGIEEYIWTAVADSRTRDDHADLDGQKFRYDDPPVSGTDGFVGHPGEPAQCRCVAYPVIPALEDDE